MKQLFSFFWKLITFLLGREANIILIAKTQNIPRQLSQWSFLYVTCSLPRRLSFGLSRNLPNIWESTRNDALSKQSLTTSNSRHHSRLSEIQKFPTVGPGDNQKSPPWANFPIPGPGLPHSRLTLMRCIVFIPLMLVLRVLIANLQTHVTPCQKLNAYWI